MHIWDKGKKQLTFKNVEGREIPTRPWPQVFYVSAVLDHLAAVEVRPLTVTGLIRGIGKNLITKTFWRIVYGCHKIGFIDYPIGENLSLRKHWRWRFWRPKAREIKVTVLREGVNKNQDFIAVDPAKPENCFIAKVKKIFDAEIVSIEEGTNKNRDSIVLDPLSSDKKVVRKTVKNKIDSYLERERNRGRFEG